LLVSNFYYFDNTPPDSVLDNFDGRFSITSKSYLTFTEYYDINKPKISYQSVSDYRKVPVPRFSPSLSKYYNTESNNLNSCSGKFLKINFSNFKYSSFDFNYSYEHFHYNLKLFDDVYSFSNKLKSEDCYYDLNNYEKSYFAEPYNNKFIEGISHDFENLRNRYSNDEIVEIATIFVQSIPYGSDTTKRNRYPYETLYENQGNCLDKSVILSGILNHLNYTSYIITGKDEYGVNHAFVGVKCQNQNSDVQSICYIETTTYYPISTNYNDFITTDKSEIQISEGGNVYNEVRYGPKVIESLQNKINEIDQIINRLDNRYRQYYITIDEFNDLIKRGYEIEYEIKKEMFDNM